MSTKPSVITSFYEMYDHLRGQGLTEDDIILLIQKRTKPKVNITEIRSTIEAIKTFEKQIEKALSKED